MNMVTIAVLSADQRLSFQIHSWLKALADNVRWETYTDVAAFAQKIETEIAADLVAQSKSADDAILDAEDIGAGKSKEAVDAYYRLLIVDVDLLNIAAPQAVEWAIKLKKLMFDRERSDPLFPVKVLFLSFEGGSFKVDAFSDPAIDDLILKPLDRSVFLQKIEILTADDPGIKPTFLFRQKANITIEIGKDAIIDEISEFSLAIRNPAPLADGVFAAIHCVLLGPADLARVIGRVYKSEKHPRLPGQYLVRFGYFGLRADQLANVKKFVRDRQGPARARPPQLPMSDQDPSIPFNRVAVVDMNEEVFTEVQSAMKDHYVGVQTTHYPSYARFLAALKTFDPSALQRQVDEATTAAHEGDVVVDDSHGARAWSMPGNLVVSVLSPTLDLLRFESILANGDTVFGRTRQEWTERRPEFFAHLDKLDMSVFQEMIGYAMSGGSGRGSLKMRDQAKRIYFVEAVATLVKAGEGEEPSQLHVELKQIDKAVYEAHNGHSLDGVSRIQASDLMYDAIYIDLNLIRGDLREWFDNLHEAYMRAGIIAPGVSMPKIILLADEKSRSQPENYRNKIVSDFLYKPLDRKMMSFKAKLAVNEFIPRKEPDVPPFVRADLPAKLAKDAQMEELSEFGLSIAHPTPFRRGAMMRFFSPLLGGGVDGVLGRCSHCEQKEEREVSYTCHFMFFGAPDENLKRIRNWIREDYVQRKETPP